jgi:uncharacterized protein
MKRILAIFILFFISFQTVSAQTNATEKKSITVEGSAEMEIIPDEIYFTIILREYLNKDKEKITTEKLEKELQASVISAGIAKENLQIANVYGEQWITKKRKPLEFFSSKRYVLKLSDPAVIDLILDKLDPTGIERVTISRFSHSKLDQYMKDLRIQAIRNAKDKANYLLAAIDEQLGSPIYIYENKTEPIAWDLNSAYEYGRNPRSGYFDYDNDGGNNVGFKTITIRFEITAEFKIKYDF